MHIENIQNPIQRNISPIIMLTEGHLDLIDRTQLAFEYVKTGLIGAGVGGMLTKYLFIPNIPKDREINEQMEMGLIAFFATSCFLIFMSSRYIVQKCRQQDEEYRLRHEGHTRTLVPIYHIR